MFVTNTPQGPAVKYETEAHALLHLDTLRLETQHVATLI